MPATWSRRRLLGAAGLAGTAAAVAAACSKPAPGGVAADGSVTIDHVFGQTRIPGPPTRVVSAGLTEGDDLLALGVVPVGLTAWFGGQPFGLWPWALPKLGAAQPAVLTLDNGIQVDAIAALKPDLILAVNAGLDADTYARLSAIAPTVAQSGQDAFFEPWQDQARTVGRAVFKDPDMSRLVTAVQDGFTAAGKDHPAFAGKKVFLADGRLTSAGATVIPGGGRTEFLTAMGLTVPDTLGDYRTGGGAAVPRDRLADVLDRADAVIWLTDSDATRAALLADPAVAALAVVRTNRSVFCDPQLSAAISYATVLSYPAVTATLPGQLAGVLR